MGQSIAFDYTNSRWDGTGTFAGTGTAGSTVGGTPAYYGVIQSGGSTIFGFTNTSAMPTTAADYNLSGTALTAGKSLALQFTNLPNAPYYLAYTGGALTSYSYSSGTLTLGVSTVNPVASTSDATGSTLGSAFGVMIVTGSDLNLGGTVFRTDMFWDDISPKQNYAGTNFVAAINASGVAGQTATFQAYLPTTFLATGGINEPADAEARYQKSGTSSQLLNDLAISLYAAANPHFTGEGTLWNYAGSSAFDFDGGGADAFVLATYSNSNWSDGDIGISAVPEPSTYAALFGSLALLTALWRRRAINNAPMR